MAEKYYDVNMYGYCHMNPMNRIDQTGKEDSDPQKQILWGEVLNGFSSMVGGTTGMIVCYAASAEAPTPLNGILVLYGTNCLGTATIGFAYLLSGFAGEELNLPKTMSGIYGRMADTAVGNDSSVLETTADIVEGMAGVTVKTPPNLSIINKISRISLIQTIADIGIKLKSISGNPKNSESYDRTQTQIDHTKVDNKNDIKT